MLDDKKMRNRINRVLGKHQTRSRTQKAARLAAAVGASGKLIAGCIVVEYGVPTTDAGAADAAVVDGTVTDNGSIDLATTAEYAAPFDAAVDDLSALYAAPFDAGDIDVGAVAEYAAPFDAGDVQPLYAVDTSDAGISADDAGVVALYGVQVMDAGISADDAGVVALYGVQVMDAGGADLGFDDVGAVALYGIAVPDAGVAEDVTIAPMYGITPVDAG